MIAGSSNDWQTKVATDDPYRETQNTSEAVHQHSHQVDVPERNN